MVKLPGMMGGVAVRLAAACSVGLLAGAAFGASAPLQLSVNFTVAGTSDFDGVDPAALAIKKGGSVTGTIMITNIFEPPVACTVLAGSTDVAGVLKLTCSPFSDETISFNGTLKPRLGSGKGSFSESFFGQTGTYRAKK